VLASANLASHGIAARPAMAGDAAGLAAESGARHPGGLGSYVFRHRDDDASFDPTGTLRAGRRLCPGVIVASGRLAHGNPSAAIGVDMHLTALLTVVRRWRMAVAGGQERRAAAFAASCARSPTTGL
jgi:hypothetical protein